ncbi:MAG: cobyrinate a,c-diamide synthase [Syntrophomonadaceae bacterium]|jgi:cobyrinic acid a,c-diamide synthase
MKQRTIPRIMIAAAGSGCGKTTITCGLLQALRNRGKKLTAFKCGPDYIDPMFHSEVLGINSRNLDLFFADANTIRYLLGKNARGCDLAIIEGVMGYYDGLTARTVEYSSYDLACKTETPVVLVVDCKGMSLSVLAVIKGFVEMRSDSKVQGIILNRLPPVLYDDMKKVIAAELNIQVLGYLPELKDCQIESRHLGLVTAQEIGNLKEITARLARQVENCVDLDKILHIAEQAVPVEYDITEEFQNISKFSADVPIKIAVARDKAFCFYYQDNLDLLKQLGAEIVTFSPLEDKSLPADINGIIIGGGYPELYLKQLAENENMLLQIKQVIGEGLPCLAECGGFMYLHQYIEDKQGTPYKMVGAIEGSCFPTDKLRRFGYISLAAREDNLLCEKGTEIRAHEFHYWDSTNPGNSFHAQKPLRKANWDCVISGRNFWAGFPHIHFYNNTGMAIRFINQCASKKREDIYR